ncbi:hypothetical protein [Cognatiyoonia koreensis]|nr:hypothetical protein [Cognatiyoonia koreensis]
MTKTLITEDDVAAFEIIGYLNGKRIGSWNIDARTADQTWHLRFDPVSMTFLTGGWFASTNSQGWNADGSVDNCGAPGFGFNSGSYAQDICLNGAYIRGSSIPPETPIFATTAKVMPDCNQTIPMGKRHKTNRMLDGESVLP